MLNKPIPAGDMLELIAYRRILMYKYINPNYAHKYTVNMIASRVIRLTAGCVSRCNTPEPCLVEPCNIEVVLNTTTTTTTINYYYYSGSNCNSPLFSQVIRSLVLLSRDDVVLATDGSCYTIGGVYVDPDYSAEYVSTETCFTAPCPTTTTTTTI
jgi:hypothetical protein